MLKRLLAETEKERHQEEVEKRELVLQVQRLIESKNVLDAQLLNVKQNNVPSAQVQLTIIKMHFVKLLNCLAIEHFSVSYIMRGYISSIISIIIITVVVGIINVSTSSPSSSLLA